METWILRKLCTWYGNLGVVCYVMQAASTVFCILCILWFICKYLNLQVCYYKGCRGLDWSFKILKKDLFILLIWKAELHRRGETEILHPFIHSPTSSMARDGPVWRQEPGAQRFFLVFHVDAGAQALGPSCAAFLDTLAGSWIRSTGLKPVLIWNASYNQRLNVLWHNVGPWVQV